MVVREGGERVRVDLQGGVLATDLIQDLGLGQEQRRRIIRRLIAQLLHDLAGALHLTGLGPQQGEADPGIDQIGTLRLAVPIDGGGRMLRPFLDLPQIEARLVSALAGLVQAGQVTAGGVQVAQFQGQDADRKEDVRFLRPIVQYPLKDAPCAGEVLFFDQELPIEHAQGLIIRARGDEGLDLRTRLPALALREQQPDQEELRLVPAGAQLQGAAGRGDRHVVLVSTRCHQGQRLLGIGIDRIQRHQIAHQVDALLRAGRPPGNARDLEVSGFSVRPGKLDDPGQGGSTPLHDRPL